MGELVGNPKAFEEKIDALNSKLINYVKEDTASGTTTASGNLMTSIPKERKILFAFTSLNSVSYHVIPWQYGNSDQLYWSFQIRDQNSFSPVANTAITIKYFYAEY